MSSLSDLDGGWAWCVLGAAYFCQLMCSGLAFVAGMFQLTFLQEFQGSIALTSWVTGLFSALLQLGGPLASAVANTLSCRTSVMLGGALLSVGFFISGMANSLQWLMVSFGAIAGLGMGLTYTPSIVIISFFFHKKRTVANGIATSAGGLGIVLAPQISQLLFDTFNWRETLFILAAISTQICVAGALMFPIHEHIRKNKMCCCRGAKELSSREVKEDKEDIEFVLSRDNNDCGEKDRHDCDWLELENQIGHNDSDDKGGNDKKLSSSNEIKLKINQNNSTRLLVSPDSYCNEHDDTSAICDARGKPSLNDKELDGSDRVIGENERINSKLSKSHEKIHLTNSIKTETTNKLSSVSHGDLNLSNNLTSSLHQSTKKIHKSDSDFFKQIKDPNYHDDSSRTQSGGAGGMKLIVISNTPSMSSLISSARHIQILVQENTVNDGNDDKSLGHFTTKQNGHNYGNNFMEQRIILGAEESAMLSNNEHPKGEIETLLDTSLILKQGYPPLYKNGSLILLCLVLFLNSAGSGCFLIHVPGFLQGQGLSEWEVTNVLSMNGIAILLGRCLLGALVNAQQGNEELFFIAMQIIGGIFMILFPIFGTSYASCMGLMFAVAAYCGTVYSMLPVLTILYAGLGSLSTALGIEMVFCGAGFLIAPPIAGIAIDITGNYDINAYGGGLMFAVAGIAAMVLPWMSKKKR